MEEQTRLQVSSSGYKGHVTQLYNKIDELVTGEFNEYTTTSLTNVIKQITKKISEHNTSESARSGRVARYHR